MLILYLLLIFGAFPVLMLYGCKIHQDKQYNDTFLSRDASAWWRGVAAGMVIFAHLTIYLEEKGIDVSIAKVYDWVGGMGVLIFFFLSGYGTALSLQKKKMHFRWLLSHVLWLWVPVVIIRCFFFWGSETYRMSPNLSAFVLYVIGYLEPAWFVNVLLTVYATVYISKKLFPKHYLLSLLVLNTATSILFYVLGFEPRWYNGHLLYVFGAWIALRGVQYKDKIHNHWWMSLLCSAAMFAVFALLFSKFKPALISAVFKLCSGMGLNLMIVVISQKVKEYGNVGISLGKMSLYLYIIHCSLYPLLDRILPQSPFAVVYISIPVALILSKACYLLELKAAGKLK